MTHILNPAAVLAHVYELLEADPDYQLRWLDLGHADWEGQPTVQTTNGPVTIPPYPNRPGNRAGGGGL